MAAAIAYYSPMCGRLNIHNSAAIQQLMAKVGLPVYPLRPPRYNVTPTSQLDVVFGIDDIAVMEWGIEFGKFRHPNTKVETIRRRPDLQRLWLSNRCLVPANRFYEWPDAKVRPKYQDIKTRFCIHTPEDAMLLGGIYKVSEQGVLQFNVLTTDPNERINDFHHRMPVIVPAESAREWLTADGLDALYRLAVPYTRELVVYECDPYVNSGRHEGPQCMAPAPPREERTITG